MSEFSAYKKEKEVLLPPGVQFMVEIVGDVPFSDGVHLVEMKEVSIAGVPFPRGSVPLEQG